MCAGGGARQDAQPASSGAAAQCASGDLRHGQQQNGSSSGGAPTGAGAGSASVGVLGEQHGACGGPWGLEALLESGASREGSGGGRGSGGGLSGGRKSGEGEKPSKGGDAAAEKGARGRVLGGGCGGECGGDGVDEVDGSRSSDGESIYESCDEAEAEALKNAQIQVVGGGGDWADVVGSCGVGMGEDDVCMFAGLPPSLRPLLGLSSEENGHCKQARSECGGACKQHTAAVQEDGQTGHGVSGGAAMHMLGRGSVGAGAAGECAGCQEGSNESASAGLEALAGAYVCQRM